MSETKTPARPTQVTLAGWIIIAGSVFVVLAVFEAVSGMHTLEVRERVERALSEPPADGLGIGVERMLSIMHVLALVAGGCAAAAAVLGWHVLQRSRSARVALSVLALPLFVSGLVAGGFMSSMVAVAALMLWTQPARDWFNGKTPQGPSEKPQSDRMAAFLGTTRTPDRPVETPDPPAAEPPSDEAPAEVPDEGPRPYVGFGSQPVNPYAQQPRPDLPPGLPPFPQAPERRPTPVVLACVLTWVMSGFALLMSLTILAVLAISRDTLLDEFHKQDSQLADRGVTDTMLLVTTGVMVVAIAAWCLAAMVVATFAWRRHAWARIALLISAATAAAASLITVISAPFVVVTLAAAVLTVVFLSRAETVAWFARRR